MAIAKETALRGFDEIQFDYIRFPDNARRYNPITVFPGREGKDKDEGIEDFLVFATKELDPYGVHVAADVFGQATISWDDTPEDIGQTWRKMSNNIEYMCPMIYPSHYGPGVYGYNVPDQHPYGVVRKALEQAIERNSAQENPAIIRPWIQGFNAPWVPGYINYGPVEIAEQIRAGYELGIEEYIIWDPVNTYDPMIFFYHDRVGDLLPEQGKDYRGRTPEDTLDIFLKAEKYSRYSQLYLLTPRDLRQEDYDEFAEHLEATEFDMDGFDVHEVTMVDEDNYLATVTASYTSTEGFADVVEGEYRIVREDGIFKVDAPELAWQNPDDYPLGLLPNEDGRIMVLMYHNIGKEEDTWVRTPENFMKDLNTLYEKGYRPISLTDYVTGNITTEAGYTPVVITVDDANRNNFDYLEDGTLNPDCMVAMLLDFHETHPDFPLEVTFFADGEVPFTQRDMDADKVNFLLEKGMDIGNHTENHNSLKDVTTDELQRYIGVQATYLESLVEDSNYEVNTLSLPYGQRPTDDSLMQYLEKGTYDGETYENIAILNVGWYPAYSPYDDENFDPLSIPRVRASEMDVDNVGMYNYLEYYDKNPEKRFISDGDPDVITLGNH